MKSEASRGRHGPFWEGYRPHLIVAGKGEYLGVIVVDLPKNRAVHPGDRAQVSFHLVYHPAVDYSALQPGMKFEILEGPRSVGDGVVISCSDEFS